MSALRLDPARLRAALDEAGLDDATAALTLKVTEHELATMLAGGWSCPAKTADRIARALDVRRAVLFDGPEGGDDQAPDVAVDAPVANDVEAPSDEDLAPSASRPGPALRDPDEAPADGPPPFARAMEAVLDAAVGTYASDDVELVETVLAHGELPGARSPHELQALAREWLDAAAALRREGDREPASLVARMEREGSRLAQRIAGGIRRRMEASKRAPAKASKSKGAKPTGTDG